jgi:hypothetical protein
MQPVRGVVADKEPFCSGAELKNYSLEAVLAIFLPQMMQVSVMREGCTSFIYHIDSLCIGGVSVLRATFNVSYFWSDAE